MEAGPALIETFLQMAAFPHPSGGEAALRDHILAQARQSGWEWKQDVIGNLAIFVPASPGMEQTPAILLQAHLDMVGVAAADNPHDFVHAPVRVIEHDGWLSAVGTSLGADNVAGCAMALCLAYDKALAHGPLELLFTVEEETGMRGMQALSPGLIDASIRFAINLDFEAEDYICIGGAGGRVIHARAVLPTITYETGVSWKVRARGVQGGHSGLDLAARPLNLHHFLFSSLAQWPASLLAYEGGEAVNTIPSWAEMALVVPAAEDHRLPEALKRQAEAFVALYAHAGGAPALEFEPLAVRDKGTPRSGLSPAMTAHLARTITRLPNGIQTRHAELGGAPQSSVSLGVVRLTHDGTLEAGIGIRSDNEAEAVTLEASLRVSLSQLANFSYQTDAYPAWRPEPEAPLVKHCQRCRDGLFPSPATLYCVHAGIEGSLLAAQRPDLQVVSIGPNIIGAHSIQERVSTLSMRRVYAWLGRLVGEIDRAG